MLQESSPTSPTLGRRVYIAAPLSELARAREAAGVVLQLGGRVASSWHEEVQAGCADPDDERLRTGIVQSLVRDLLRMDALVALADQGRPKGTLVEVGYALALSVPVFWLAPRDLADRCIFDAHPLVKRIFGWAELVRGLEAHLRTAALPASAVPP